MLRILILEDDDNRIATFTKTLGGSHCLHIVKEAADAITILQTETEEGRPYDVLFLDHDLGNETMVDMKEKNTGSEVVRWLVRTDLLLEQPYIFIHSLNTPAARVMERNLKYNDRFIFVHRIPFTRLVSAHLYDPDFLTI